MRNLKVKVEYDGMIVSIKLVGGHHKIQLNDETDPKFMNFLYENGYSEYFIDMGGEVKELPLMTTKKTKNCNCKNKK